MNRPKKSTDVIEIYNKKYFLNQVDGFREYSSFSGKYEELFERYQKNIELLNLENHHILLEYGCGRGEICIFHTKNGGKATGVDYSSDAIELAQKKAADLNISVNFLVSSFSEFPIKENSYDRILASEFIEHISKGEGADFLKIARQALKPGGKLLIFTFPNTIQRKFGYPILRIAYFIFGKNLPKTQPDTTSEHYKLYHLNEQNFFALRNSALKAGFTKFKIGYDIPYSKESGIFKNAIKKIIHHSVLRHIFFSNLYLLAEK